MPRFVRVTMKLTEDDCERIDEAQAFTNAATKASVVSLAASILDAIIRMFQKDERAVFSVSFVNKGTFLSPAFTVHSGGLDYLENHWGDGEEWDLKAVAA